MNKAQENALIQQHYPHMGSDAMSRDYLPHLTPKNIRDRAGRMKVRYTGPRIGYGEVWTAADRATLHRLYVIGGAEAAQAVLKDRTIAAIKNQAWKDKIPAPTGCGSPTRKDFGSVPVHDSNAPEADAAVMLWTAEVKRCDALNRGWVGARLAA